MKNLVIIISLLILAISAQAQLAQQESIMEQANLADSSEDFSTAVSNYESVLASDYESADLYFNLGNAHFKLGNIPAAILYYEKAWKMDPTDENIHFNLDLANSRIIDKMEPVPEFFLKTWLKMARDLFSSDQWAKLVIIGFILSLFSIAIFIISRTVVMRKLSFWQWVLHASRSPAIFPSVQPEWLPGIQQPIFCHHFYANSYSKEFSQRE